MNYVWMPSAQSPYGGQYIASSGRIMPAGWSPVDKGMGPFMWNQSQYPNVSSWVDGYQLPQVASWQDFARNYNDPATIPGYVPGLVTGNTSTTTSPVVSDPGPSTPPPSAWDLPTMLAYGVLGYFGLKALGVFK